MKSLRICNDIINEESSTFIIAEAGISHMGDIDFAKELVNVATTAKVDAVKFQTFWNLDRLSDYELTQDEFIELKRYCDSKDIMFLSTPHTLDAIDFIDALVPIHKVASPFLTDYRFLKKIASKQKPILVSTGSLKHGNGMATFQEIEKALNVLSDCEVYLLHCISKYPCYNNHIERIEYLKKFDYIVGLSDHTKEINVLPLPIIEKHIMLRDYPDCPDYNVSLYPDEFIDMVQYIRNGSKV